MSPVPFNEAQRQEALYALDILDSPPEQAFDRITRLVAQQFSVPIALISLLDPSRQWFKSRVGLAAEQTPREVSFCQFAIMDEEVMQVTDAARDPRFADSPLVTGDPRIRFYAGAPLITDKGFRLGTLCLIDSKPRPALDQNQQARLRDFAELVVREMELRRLRNLLGDGSGEIGAELADSLSSMRRADEALAQEAQADLLAHVAHELRTPLGAMLGFAEIIRREHFGKIGDPRYADYARQIEDCGLHLLDVLCKMLDLSRASHGSLTLEETSIDVEDTLLLAEKLCSSELDRFKTCLEMVIEPDLPDLFADRSQVAQMLVNLISNAAHFCPENTPITVTAGHMEAGGMALSVIDHGRGMNSEEIDKALAPFGRVNPEQQRHQMGLGVGLPLTKRLIELHGGSLAIESAPNLGTTMTLQFPAYRLRTPAMAELLQQAG